VGSGTPEYWSFRFTKLDCARDSEGRKESDRQEKAGISKQGDCEKAPFSACRYMNIYRLVREQLIHRPLEETFAFFADPRNLEAITPPWLRFEIVKAPDQLKPGSEIVYRLKWHGLSLRWTSEIQVWTPPFTFVDVQKSGPYALWQHAHRFIAQGEATLVTDEVHYALPFGPLGRLAHALRVRRDIEAIFDYRGKCISRLLDRMAAVRRGPI
jgi:ligand-binding SRPBCC domain-containing protein